MQKRDKNTLLKQALCWLLVIIACLAAHAQKLSSVQQASLRAPANVKTDGKLTEWGEQLQAYNNSTQVYYTMANNNDHLFLAIKVKDPGSIKKIIFSGITFKVGNTMSITFPLIKDIEGASIGIKLSEYIPISDSINRVKQTDSLVRLMNMDIANKTKEIKIKGFNNFRDSLISVYNDDDIKAAVAFDNSRALIYELSIPLKYLGLTVLDQSKFHYKIIINGMDDSKVVKYPDGTKVFGIPTGLSSESGNIINANTWLYPTDFWGEYALAK